MHRQRTLARAALLAALATSPAFADRVELKTGEVFRGTILRSTRDEVAIQLTAGGILSFRRSQIQSVRQYGVSEEETQKPEPPVVKVAPAKPAPAPAPAPRPAPVVKEAPLPPPPPPVTPPPVPPPVLEARQTVAPEVFPEQGVEMVVPKGFQRWPEGESPVVQLAWRDPFTQSSCTMSIHPAEKPLLEIKESTLGSLKEQLKSIRVHRDEAFQGNPVSGGKPQEGWVVETESKIGEVSIRQLQLFTRHGDELAVLSFTIASDEAHEKLRRSLEEALASFRFVEPSPEETPAPPADK